MSSARFALGLLALVAGQDVEPAEGSDGMDGRWRIARKVAPDRVISSVDPQARHTRKSKSARRDGFRADVAAEPETGLITGCQMTMAAGEGSGDAENGVALTGRDRFHGGGEVARDVPSWSWSDASRSAGNCSSSASPMTSAVSRAGARRRGPSVRGDS